MHSKSFLNDMWGVLFVYNDEEMYYPSYCYLRLLGLVDVLGSLIFVSNKRTLNFKDRY